ncbi:MAG: hypothetical protein ABL921_13605 [Pirellula sp.]
MGEFKLNRTGLKILLNLFACVFALVVATPNLWADTITLYDGAGLPANQSWLAYTSIGGAATQSSVAGGVRLQTDLQSQSGYSNYTILSTLKNAAFPTLNRSVGFELSFSLAIASESHSNNDRAGFSTILLGSDRRGIELGFWNNEIWAQSSSPLFQHAEGVAVNTSVVRNYRLQILNDVYTLMDGNNLLLSGAVRDYTAFNGAPGGVPYSLANYAFLGDDTTSGAADITLGMVTLQSNLSAVPEPASLSLLLAAVFVMLLLWQYKNFQAYCRLCIRPLPMMTASIQQR